jgi:hypothetical protein
MWVSKFESSTCRTATFGLIPGLQKTLELREAIFSPEMIWETVPQCRCSKSVLKYYKVDQIYKDIIYIPTLIKYNGSGKLPSFNVIH